MSNFTRFAATPTPGAIIDKETVIPANSLVYVLEGKLYVCSPLPEEPTISELQQMIKELRTDLRQLRLACAPIPQGSTGQGSDMLPAMATMEKVMAGEELPAQPPINKETTSLPIGRKKRMKSNGPTFSALCVVVNAGEEGILFSQLVTEQGGSPTNVGDLNEWRRPLTYLAAEGMVRFEGSRSILTRRYFVTSKGHQMYHA